VRRLVVVALVLLAAGCSRLGSDPPPKALVAYLDDLTAGNLREAYDRTQLEQIMVGAGASLSFEHFEAFYRANPVTSYAITRVTRLELRTSDAPTERGSAFYDVEIELRFGDRAQTETVTVEGEVLPVVQLDPASVFVRIPGGAESVLIDGVETTPAASPAIEDGYTFLLLRGSHELALDGRTVAFTADPLTVVAGDARIEGEAPPVLVLS